jgi:hypothetical protein
MAEITLDDFLEINNLVSIYFLSTDDADLEEFMNCWVEDDSFGSYDLGVMGKLNTRTELSKFIKEKYIGEGGLAQGKRHISTNITFKIVSETEVLVTHDMIVVEVSQKPAIFITGRYNNSVVVKTNKGWKFKSRTLTLDPGSLKLLS